MEEFPDEISCKLKFKEIRDQEGVVCRNCGSKDHYWLSTIWQYQCKQCKTRTTLRSGTVMQSSKLSFKYWLIAMHLVTSTKKPFSALELQRQIGHKFYEPIWYMMQKLRKTMGIRDSQYKLDKVVELDEGFFESVNTDKNHEGRSQKRKRGRGSQKQTKVVVMASTVQPEKKPGKHKKSTKFRYVKMVVVDNLKSSTMNQIVKEAIDESSIVITDNYPSYNGVLDHVKCHESHNASGVIANKVLPWVHTMISNAKRNFLGIHHMISKKYFQDYVDEFCYKVNRRYFGHQLFDRLLVACVKYNYKAFVNVS